MAISRALPLHSRFTIRAVDPQALLMDVSRQPWSRGTLCIAQDVRGDYQVVSPSCSGLRDAIETACHQRVGLSSLHDSASGRLRGGVTNAFRVLRLPVEEAIAHLNETRGCFRHRLVAAAHEAAFRFHDEGGAAPSHTLTARPCHAAPKCMARPPAPCYAPAAR